MILTVKKIFDDVFSMTFHHSDHSSHLILVIGFPIANFNLTAPQMVSAPMILKESYGLLLQS